jgi:hypothetical protein
VKNWHTWLGKSSWSVSPRVYSLKSLLTMSVSPSDIQQNYTRNKQARRTAPYLRWKWPLLQVHTQRFWNRWAISLSYSLSTHRGPRHRRYHYRQARSRKMIVLSSQLCLNLRGYPHLSMLSYASQSKGDYWLSNSNTKIFRNVVARSTLELPEFFTLTEWRTQGIIGIVHLTFFHTNSYATPQSRGR